MEQWQMGEIIASRTFTVVGGNEQLVVEIGKPQPFPDSGYYCAIRISGVGMDRVKQVGGLDAAQALQVALHMLKVDLTAINKRLEKALRWNGETDLGF